MDGTTSNGRSRRLVARVVAVLAIAAAIVALVVVIGGSNGPSDGGGGDRAARRSAEREKTQNSPATYVVQPDESLTEIAARFDVSVDRLLKLNPEVDPQLLQEGQTLKLR
ncbi:MAG: LysM domain-containing protein [bacterium]